MLFTCFLKLYTFRIRTSLISLVEVVLVYWMLNWQISAWWFIIHWFFYAGFYCTSVLMYVPVVPFEFFQSLVNMKLDSLIFLFCLLDFVMLIKQIQK